MKPIQQQRIKNFGYHCLFVLLLLLTATPSFFCNGFLSPATTKSTTIAINRNRIRNWKTITNKDNNSKKSTQLYVTPLDDEEREQIEKARLGIWKSRRKQIRSMLKSAESVRNFRIHEGYLPELDENGKPIKDNNGKSAVTITAFAVAMGAIVLRVGGRAALVSAVGLDFMTDNPDLQGQVNQILEYADTVDPIIKGGLFCLAWTLVKVLCFDAAGIVLALSSGILFGGVFQGTFMSALGATVGSSVAFALAKADTPVRKKALEIVQDNPSLRGIEKVVAEDGLKAVLTLRLAPILPIPLGMYNYVYGISNVKYFDFAGGIFFGSIKPYLLDSYLGYFGKTLVDGTAGQDGGLQDYILVGVLGFSVLIGVFASQLASETWDAVLEEQKAEEEEKKDEEDNVVTEIFGWELPKWAVGFQYSLQDADKRMAQLLLQEFDAKVWNYTEEESFLGVKMTENTIPDDKNPALKPNSPEITGQYKGVEFAEMTCDGLVLSPILFSYFLEFADPLFDEQAFRAKNDMKPIETIQVQETKTLESSPSFTSAATLSTPPPPSSSSSGEQKVKNSDTASGPSLEFQTGVLLNQLQALRDEANERLQTIDKKIDQIDKP
jgi:uncharacterized membrane protein YdjX (TVP38/TMEM64 family)